MRRKRWQKLNNSTRRNGVIIFVMAFMLLAYFIYYWSFTISPNLDKIAEMKAKLIVSKAVNEAIRDRLYEESAAGNLLLVETDESGTMEMVQSNTPAINKLLSDLSAELQARYKNGNLEQKSTVPLGSILGSRIISQYGPSIELTIIPVAVSHMDFMTEFETQGINQTKYKVYAVLNTEARVLAPFTTDTIEIENTILIAEAIILGQVPQSYVNVPENEILDGMD